MLIIERLRNIETEALIPRVFKCMPNLGHGIRSLGLPGIVFIWSHIIAAQGKDFLMEYEEVRPQGDPLASTVKKGSFPQKFRPKPGSIENVHVPLVSVAARADAPSKPCGARPRAGQQQTASANGASGFRVRL